jgi:hypothetical protein
MALAPKLRTSTLTLACAAALACTAAAPADAAVTATVANGTLMVTGDDATADVVKLQLASGAPGTLNVFVSGDLHSSHNRSQFTRILLRGGRGGDRLVIDDLLGAFTHQEQTTIEGGDQADVIGGGAGAEVIDGGTGDDFIEGEGFNSKSALPGADILRGGPGKDSFDWDPDQGRDLIDGGADADSVRLVSDRADERFDIGRSEELLVATRTFPEDGADAAVALSDVTELLELETRGGNDTVVVGENLPKSIALKVNGGSGTDTILGGTAGETILGGADADVLKGGGGDDAIAAGDGDDELHGDAGTDTLDGGAGVDRFFCGGFGDLLVAEQGIDVIGDDCVEPQAAPQPDQPQPEPQPQPQPEQPQPVAPVAAFAKPKVRGTLKVLTVSVRNTGGVALDLRVGASEKAGGRSFRYAKRTLRVAPGATAKVTLRAPVALRRLLTRMAARRSLLRKPTITVADRTAAGAGSATVKARVALKRVR